MKKLLVFILINIFLYSCSRTPATDCNGKPYPNDLSITIKKGESATLYDCGVNKFVIHFIKVTEDSRCPANANCVWKGTAVIAISINDDKNLIPLALDSTIKVSPSQKKYSIKFEKLDPYPYTTSPIDPADYKATLLIKKD